MTLNIAICLKSTKRFQNINERREVLNNILKKGTVLLLAMMMIITCGAFNMTYVHAAEEIKTLKVKVVDGSGNPMPDIEMEFYNQYSQDYPTFTTDENGVGTFTIDPDNPVLFAGADYEVKPASPGYKSIDTTVVTIGGSSDEEAYFEKVNDEDYTGDTVTVGIKEQSFKITVKGGSANVKESAPGKTITISADSTGYEFSKWTDKTGKLKFKNANLAKTEFTMPASDVTITANFTKNKIVKFTAGSRWDEYLEGDTFKLKDAKVEDPDGNIKSVNTDLVTVEPDRPLTAADKEVTASYSGFSVTIPVNVKKKVDWPVMNDLPANQPKDIWETATERVSDIGITGVQGNASGLKFVFYDVTTQDPKDTIEVAANASGYLTDINLKRDHNYLIYLKSDEYFMQNVYGWVHDGKLRDIKDVAPDKNDSTKAVYNYKEINNFNVTKVTQSTTSNYSRYTTAIPVKYNDKAMPGIKFRLVSPVETLEATTDENGILKAELLEDVNYMVSVESDKYAVEAFPLAVKDKSEYRMGKFAYDHSDCQGVGPKYNKEITPIQLVDKGTERKNDKTITSVSGDTTISGMNFKDLYCVEKKMDTKVSGLSDGTYDVYDIEAMNPHRSEVSKLAAGDFTVTEKTRAGVKVKAVYMLSSDGKLKALSFKQTKSGEPVTFKANSIGVNNVVIQYYDSLGKYTDVMGHGAVWNKGGKTPYIAKFENTDPTKNDETIDNFMGISIDGKELVRDQDYVAKAGSVITEIRPEYMEDLSIGTHTLTAYFMDGDPVSVNFTVKVAAAEGAGSGTGHGLTTGTTVTKVSAVKTGDSFSWTPVFMFMAAAIALAAVVVFEKKRKQQR